MATSDKYDRQIRLWGAHGQHLLSSSRILLLGATAAGSEVLKNLILPGIKEFTIVDDSIVEQRDLGNNFFLTQDRLGESKAMVMCENLNELNPDDVTGKYQNMSIEQKLSENGIWGMKYDLVIGSDLNNRQALLASAKCRYGDKKIPFVLLRQYGLVASLRLDLESVCVME